MARIFKRGFPLILLCATPFLCFSVVKRIDSIVPIDPIDSIARVEPMGRGWR